MGKIRRGAFVIALCAFLLAVISLPAQAKVLQLRDTSLTDVTEARELKGEWVEKGDRTLFRKPGGSFAKHRWLSHDGRIYYVNDSGSRVHGWVRYRDRLYYLGRKGLLQDRWLEQKGSRYYLGEDGAAAAGLSTVEGAEYYFDPDTGAAKSGWIRIGKYDYYFSADSFRMKKKSWILTDGKYYYVTRNGRKRSQGWLNVGGRQYYLDASGARVTGELILDGKGYFFKKNGVYDPEVKVKVEVDPAKPMVALTFDDGPGPYTNRLLDCLEKNKAKATFFMVGSSVPSYKSTVKRMADMGCELGAHSYSHSAFSSLSNAAIASEVSRTAANIRSAAGSGPTVFRLPYGDGHSSSRVLQALGFPSIYWSIDTRDWANTGNPSHTVNEVLTHVHSGDIVLMHDIHYSTVVAAERIIPELKKRGYQLVTVSQLAKYKGKTTLQNGRTYYHFR